MATTVTTTPESTEEMRALVDSLAEEAINKFYQSRADEQAAKQASDTVTVAAATSTKQKKKKKKKKKVIKSQLTFGDVDKFNVSSWCSTYADEYLNDKKDTPRPATPRTPDGKIHCWTDKGRVNLKLLAQVTDEENLESIQQRRDATGQCSEYLDQYADFDASVIQQRSVTKPEVGNAVGECLDFAAGLKERNQRKSTKTKHIFTASKKNVWISSYNAAFS